MNEKNIEATNSKSKKFSLKRIAMFFIIFLIALSLIPWVVNKNLINSGVDDNKWIQVEDKYIIGNVIISEFSSFVEQNYYYLQQNPYMLAEFLNNLISQNVNTLLLANEAENLTLRIHEDDLLNIVTNIPFFQDENGVFNEDIFNQQMSSVFQNEQVFLDNISHSVLRDQLLSPISEIVKQPFFVAYIDLLSLSQTRTVEYININEQISEESLPQPSQDDLKKIRDSNQSLFTSLESRSGNIIKLDVTKFIDSVTIPDTEIAIYYEQNKQFFLSNETRNIEQITFDTQEEAENVYNKLLADEKIDEIFTSIENIEYDSLQKDFADAIFSADLQIISAPTQSQLGWHIFKVVQVNQPEVKPLEQVKEEITHTLVDEQKSQIINEKRNEIINLLEQNFSLEEIAKKDDNIVYSNFDSMNEDNFNTLETINITNSIFQQMNSLSDGQNSGLVEDEEGNLFIIKVNEVAPAKLQDITQIEAELKEIWYTEKTEEKINQLENDILEQIARDKNISDLSYETKVFNSSLMESENDIPFSEQTIENIFTSDMNIPIIGTLNDTSRIVAVVTNIENKDIPYDTDNIRNQEVVNFAEYTSQQYTNSYFNIFLTQLLEKYDVKINEQAIINKLAPSNVAE